MTDQPRTERTTNRGLETQVGGSIIEMVLENFHRHIERELAAAIRLEKDLAVSGPAWDEETSSIQWKIIRIDRDEEPPIGRTWIVYHTDQPRTSWRPMSEQPPIGQQLLVLDQDEVRTGYAFHDALGQVFLNLDCGIFTLVDEDFKGWMPTSALLALA